jgi:hypothetical protein
MSLRPGLLCITLNLTMVFGVHHEVISPTPSNFYTPREMSSLASGVRAPQIEGHCSSYSAINRPQQNDRLQLVVLAFRYRNGRKFGGGHKGRDRGHEEHASGRIRVGVLPPPPVMHTATTPASAGLTAVTMNLWLVTPCS